MDDLNVDIKTRLLTDYQAFLQAIDGLPENQFTHQPNGKWSVADTMQHLYLSARPVVRLMTGPRDVLLQWGEADRPSKPYEMIAETYRTVLATGMKAPAAMSPKPEDMTDNQDALTERFMGVYQALLEATEGWSEDELDRYMIPHPALGKLTVREMLDFTSIHTQHHLALLPIH